MRARKQVSLEARKNRLIRRLIGALGDSAGALALLAAAALLSSVFIFVCSSVLSSPYFAIKEVAVRGVRELTEKEVLELAKVKPQTNIMGINKEVIASRVAVNPWVKTIYIGRELPDRLVLDIRERKPVALVKENGIFYLIDGEGHIFKKLSHGDDVDLPVITGVKINLAEKPPLYADTLKLLETLFTSGDYGFLGTVSEAHLDGVFGLSLLTDRGLYLKLGREDFYGKLNQLKIVLADLEKRGMSHGRLFVDLADVSKVTVERLEMPRQTKERKKGPQYRI
ncbi:MAG TPA: FtsQ-type POTRA domain-containing protein [Smithellaceae bacterium]|nr:FtsQ-type POTRA domain-containing protein [Smithellaceae bacterium]HQF83680.1 FtsQ-type POTRA domain-containing protein [Smithellaceae bacterium]HQG79771.1 FtsQ-type POTRA domain-containing protein [Smithellaceae bacterium]